MHVFLKTLYGIKQQALLGEKWMNVYLTKIYTKRKVEIL